MPSATFAELPTLSPGKKRSRNENEELQMPIFAHAGNEAHAQDKLGRLAFHNISNKRSASSFAGEVQRKILPLPSSKRARVSDDESEDHAHYGSYKDDIQRNNHAVLSNYSTPPISPQLRPQGSYQQVPVRQTLDPCHICHRKPTRKSDLDSFADCHGCGQRTCYVCIRQCQGWLPNAGGDNDSRQRRHTIFREEQQQHQHQQPEEDPLSRSFTMHDVDDGEREQWTTASLYHANNSNNISRRDPSHDHEVGWKGHASVICSRCCIERGSEGDVMCLGCLAGVEGA
ncbi:hypothetical protein PFICI_01371 [Pestalotiopsis fici W106-1]|uniref:Uncharacterized protein n=1 Tax=Pestalotiopsis fici (strain W106-1 / CGMCC3.15140) TaxID=1229662 RepID=W3XNA9_PESFW|nr:uncharacterized protein PFICI_01371 [Pestalotiopsis fici W106-1]ETS87543.1 hypothetical protein PFICI_01371 [Pestalotiopsis fici W106-1]